MMDFTDHHVEAVATGRFRIREGGDAGETLNGDILQIANQKPHQAALG
jgi:hypothetical protein